MDAKQVDRLEARAADIGRLLKVLGNDARLLVLCQLVDRGEVTAGSLTGTAGLSQSALSQHLAVLRQEGVVDYRREGQVLWYRLADRRVEELMATLYRLYCRDAG